MKTGFHVHVDPADLIPPCNLDPVPCSFSDLSDSALIKHINSAALVFNPGAGSFFP